MNKKILLTSTLALFATSLAVASENQAITANPEAKPAISKSLAYGCIGSGHGNFQGKMSCEGTVVGGCEGSGSGTPSPSPCQGAGNGQGSGTQNCSGSFKGEGACQGVTNPSPDNNCGGF